MSFSKISFVLAFCFLVITFKSEAKVSVHYGGDENVDACTSLAQVDHLSIGPNGFLAVKDAPNIKARRTDKVFNGQKLWICDESKDGKWVGVVYPSNEKQDCGVTSPVEKKKPYDGPCKSGWVSRKYVRLLAS
jgi:hypothetical protein